MINFHRSDVNCLLYVSRIGKAASGRKRNEPQDGPARKTGKSDFRRRISLFRRGDFKGVHTLPDVVRRPVG
jgi:hypothetical protein